MTAKEQIKLMLNSLNVNEPELRTLLERVGVEFEIWKAQKGYVLGRNGWITNDKNPYYQGLNDIELIKQFTENLF